MLPAAAAGRERQATSEGATDSSGMPSRDWQDSQESPGSSEALNLNNRTL